MSDLRHVLSIDSGKSSGIALGSYSDTEPYALAKCWQFGGGVNGMLDWCREVLPGLDYDEWCCEVFVPLAGRGFNHTRDSVEPVAVEGALHALGVIDRYDKERMRPPNQMYRYGGKDKKEKLKLARKFLKDHDMLPTGKVVGQKDANDAVSAILHGIAFLVKQKHGPTMKMILDWSNNG